MLPHYRARVTGESLHEETCTSASRDAFSPEHRRLHHCAPAANDDEGLMAGQLEGEGPALRRLLSF